MGDIDARIYVLRLPNYINVSLSADRAEPSYDFYSLEARRQSADLPVSPEDDPSARREVELPSEPVVKGGSYEYYKCGQDRTQPRVTSPAENQNQPKKARMYRVYIYPYLRD